MAAIMTDTSPGEDRNNGDYTVGIRFRPAVDFRITKLGREIRSPFAQDHLVQIWSDGGTLLSSCTVNSSSPVVAGYAVEDCDPVNVVTGLFYRLASYEFLDGDIWANQYTSSGRFNTDLIDFAGPCWRNGFGFPSNTNGLPFVWVNAYAATGTIQTRRRRDLGGYGL